MSSLRELFVKVDIQDSATAPLNSINGLVNQIIGGLQNLGNGTNHSLNNFQHMNSTISQLTNNLNQSTQQITSLNNRLNTAENEMQGLRVESQRMESELQQATTEMTQLRNRLDQAEQDAQELRQEMQRMAQNSQQASKSMSGFGSTMRGLVGIVATVFAVDKVKDFIVSGVEAAAGMKALDSQFGQVFGSMEQTAATSLDSIAEQTGILPQRLKGSFVQMTAFAKTTGAETADAMALAERATLAAADSAAFYDRGIEDVTENLQSFLKGNFENDAALGISATETTRNAKAMQLYKKKFKDLTEAQKQLALMEMVEDGNKAAGAIGQAARESDGFENVIGNVKSSWDKLKGSMMNPFLDTITGGLQGLSAKLSSIDGEAIGLKLKKGFDLAKDVISSLVNDTGNVSDILQNFGLPKETSDNLAGFANIMQNAVSLGISTAKTAFEGFKNVMAWAIDNQQLLIAGLSGVAAGFATLKVITMVTGLMAAYRASAFASMVATQGLNAALRANPIGLVVTAIGLLVAGGVLLYQNWDTVKAKAVELWNKINENPFASFLLKLNPIVAVGTLIYENFDKITGAFKIFKEAITNFKLPDWVSSVGGAISSGISTLTGGGGNAVDGSHATGLASVPYDGYRAELHKGEPVLTAKQGNTLRSAGILTANSDGTPNIDLTTIPYDNKEVLGANQSNEFRGMGALSFNSNGTPNLNVGSSEGVPTSAPVITNGESYETNQSTVSVPVNLSVTVHAAAEKVQKIKNRLSELEPIVRQIVTNMLDEEMQTL